MQSVIINCRWRWCCCRQSSLLRPSKPSLPPSPFVISFHHCVYPHSYCWIEPFAATTTAQSPSTNWALCWPLQRFFKYSGNFPTWVRNTKTKLYIVLNKTSITLALVKMMITVLVFVFVIIVASLCCSVFFLLLLLLT